MDRNTFRRGIEAHDLDLMMTAFAENAVLQSPISFQPFEGPAEIRKLLTIIVEVFGGFRYTDELTAPDGTTALVFRATVGGRDIEGLDLLRFDESGRIRELTVMVRPLSGKEAVLDEVGPRLAKGA